MNILSLSEHFKLFRSW